MTIKGLLLLIFAYLSHSNNNQVSPREFQATQEQHTQISYNPEKSYTTLYTYDKDKMKTILFEQNNTPFFSHEYANEDGKTSTLVVPIKSIPTCDEQQQYACNAFLAVLFKSRRDVVHINSLDNLKPIKEEYENFKKTQNN